MKKIFLLFLLLFFASPQNSWPASSIAQGDVLTLPKCIDIALTNHPAIHAATGAIRQSESKIGQARAAYYPQIVFQSSYSRVGPADTSLRGDPYNYYSNMLSLNQTLFDFGKTPTLVNIQHLGKQSSEANFQDVAAAIILGVKDAYYTYLKAKMSRSVAQETLNQFRQHYDRAKLFFETGRTSKIDVTSAEVNLSNAGISLLKADHSLRIARVLLNNAMGVTHPPDYTVKEDLTYATALPSLDESIKQAYANRPDLISISLRKESLEKTVDLNRKGYFPVLAGNAAYGYAGDDVSSETRNWNFGVTLTFPLFTGLSTKYSVDEARANLDIAKANEELLKQKVSMEVESAYLYVRESAERIDAGKIIVRQAEETLELAQGRYATGVGSSLEITDAMITLNNAKLTYISALTDFSSARANLDRAMGVSQ